MTNTGLKTVSLAFKSP